MVSEDVSSGNPITRPFQFAGVAAAPSAGHGRDLGRRSRASPPALDAICSRGPVVASRSGMRHAGSIGSRPYKVALGAVALAAVSARAGTAGACSFPGPAPYTTDQAQEALDTVPPSSPDVGQVDVMRGTAGQRGCLEAASSCDDVAFVRIAVSATDDRTAASDLGYLVTVAGGTAPPGLSLVGKPAALAADGTLTLVWTDDQQASSQAIQFDLQIQTVDRAGNVSAGAATVMVDAPGNGGCAAISPGAAGGGSRAARLLAPLVLAGAWLASRRRRPPPPRWSGAESDIRVRVGSPDRQAGA